MEKQDEQPIEERIRNRLGVLRVQQDTINQDIVGYGSALERAGRLRTMVEGAIKELESLLDEIEARHGEG